MVLQPEDQRVRPIEEVIRKFTPWGACLAVRQLEQGRTKGGLIIPDNTKENPETVIAEVLAVGPDVKRVKIGDTVLIHGATPVRKVRWNTYGASDQDFIVIEEEKILGTV